MADDISTSGSNSISSFGVTFIINFVILVAFITGFLLLRPHQKRIYQPRSTIDIIKPELRPRPLDSGIISWLRDLVTRREAEILQDAGLDGYFFLRFLRLIFMISVIGILFLFPILLPVNATASSEQTGFNLLSFTNTVNFPSRYYAHVLMGWVFYGFILFTLYRELVYYVSIRQAVLTSPAYTNNISSRTILISTVPQEFLHEDALRELFPGVKNVWINRSQTELMKKVDERDSLALKVEAAETALLKKAVKNRLKSKTPIEGSDIDQYVLRKNRPTHRLKFLIGKKVDTIEYGREQLPILNQEIEELKSKVSEASPLNSVFISFHTQEQAETALQTLAHHQALHMAPRHIGVRPDDIFWLNLRLFWWERLVRSTGAMAAITALVIFWSIPVAFVGSISNIEALTEKLHFLRFLNDLPSWISGVVSGLLPTILLAVLMALLPIFLRLMAKVSGVPSGTMVEHYVQNAYFAFLVVQVFLVTTLSSGAAAVIQDIINEPSSAMSLLASNIPKASNFYISYFLLQGFTIAGGALLQIVALILFHVLSTLLDNTPRKIWNRWNLLSTTGWGTVFPVYTNLAVIAITYSIISPMILCFSGLAFGVVYIAYLHNLLFVVKPSDGRGIYYPRAIFHTFTGLYIGEVCLLGLFVVAKAWGPVVLQAIFIGATIFVHKNLQVAFRPLLVSLPLNLLRKNSPQKAEEVPLLETGYPLEDIETNHKHSNSLSSGADLEDVRATNSKSNFGVEETTKKPKVLPININLKRPVEQMSFATQYFKPHIYLEPSVVQHDFLTVRFQEPSPVLSEQEEALAYANPAERSENPVIWIPRDPWGLADEELRKLNEQNLNAYTRGTWFDIDAEKKKFKIKYGTIDEVPIWTPPPAY
ncbi:hypothetical protein D0Z00_002175 [Geotrichum galactomycetum]|uniref:Uncharacterized protein n=1 Tax=Geotrichum galactomycetum TaxID=27317 RepID=A0ACB6V4Y7_9ASCO|nr:hypothetical protein D0Z00_002175 [Geotrichum candidum]